MMDMIKGGNREVILLVQVDLAELLNVELLAKKAHGG